MGWSVGFGCAGLVFRDGSFHGPGAGAQPAWRQKVRQEVFADSSGQPVPALPGAGLLPRS